MKQYHQNKSRYQDAYDTYEHYQSGGYCHLNRLIKWYARQYLILIDCFDGDWYARD